MTKLSCIIAGVISYSLLQVVNILFAFVSGRFNANLTLSKLVVFAAISVPGVGLIGAFIGLIFYFVCDRMPLSTIYAKSITFHLFVLVLLSTAKSINYLFSFDFVISIVATVPAAAMFAWLCINIGGRRKLPAVAKH